MPIDWGAVRSAAMAGERMAWGKGLLNMPAVKGALVGAGVGAAWGAVSEREGIVTGAMKGAMVGGLARTAWTYGKGFPQLGKMYDKAAKLNQAKNWQGNLRNAWSMMWSKKYRGATMTVGGFAAAGAAGGIFSRDDNPIGGAIGGGIGRGIQGAAVYGGYKAVRRFWR